MQKQPDQEVVLTEIIRQHVVVLQVCNIRSKVKLVKEVKGNTRAIIDQMSATAVQH